MYVNDVYQILKEDCRDLDAIYRDYIIRLVGEVGLSYLVANGLLETCGAVNGRQLYALLEKGEMSG